jgi:hypothetical protein
MATVQQVIDRVKLPGEIADSIKCMWLGELDKERYRYPDDKDTELKIKEPDDNIYDLYLDAMYAFFCGELSEYPSKAILFEDEYQAYMRKRVRF